MVYVIGILRDIIDYSGFQMCMYKKRTPNNNLPLTLYYYNTVA